MIRARRSSHLCLQRIKGDESRPNKRRGCFRRCLFVSIAFPEKVVWAMPRSSRPEKMPAQGFAAQAPKP